MIEAPANSGAARLMIFQLMKLNIDVSDEDFNAIYPERLRNLSARHWTPVAVAKLAAEFLAEKPGAKVLDIGSGAGKFCMVGSACTCGHFTGVEHRKNLVDFCVKAARVHYLRDVKFINANITSVDFGEYDSFYFYNSFRENIDQTAVIDESVETGTHLHNVYRQYVYDQLSACRIGTRVATYWTPVAEVPPGYSLVATGFDQLLRMFEKTT